VRGVLEVDGKPGVVVVAVRRYACQSCGAVMTVVPAGMLSRRQYSGPSIALALHLWLAVGLSDCAVRRQVCAWQVRGHNDRGWAQLYRWGRQAASLFALPRVVAVLGSPHEVVRRVLTQSFASHQKGRGRIRPKSAIAHRVSKNRDAKGSDS
jgi:hypothetical protein